MIKVGDIVFRQHSGGMIERIDRSKIGLVLECYKPDGTLPQYKVSFPDAISPAWWEGRHLHKIKGGKDK